MSVIIATTPAATTPPTLAMKTTDQFWFGVDLGPALPPGGAVSTPVVTLTSTAQGGKKITMAETPTLTGSVVSVLLTGADMVPGTYLLQILYNGGESAPQLTSLVRVVVSPPGSPNP